MLRPGDTLARLGGDEFAIVLPETKDAATCPTVAGKLMSELQRPVLSDGRALVATASIGTVAGFGDDTPDRLLKEADLAMYHAKQTRANSYTVADWPGEPAPLQR